MFLCHNDDIWPEGSKLLLLIVGCCKADIFPKEVSERAELGGLDFFGEYGLGFRKDFIRL